MEITDYSELGITVEDHVAVMEIQRPPHNFFDFELISQLSAACEALGENDACRTIVLCAAGKSFCAGANFGDGSGDQHQRDRQTGHLYQEAVRLFRTPKPIIAAVHGAAIGGGCFFSALGSCFWFQNRFRNWFFIVFNRNFTFRSNFYCFIMQYN